MKLNKKQIEFVKNNYNKFVELEKQQVSLYEETKEFLKLVDHSPQEDNLWEHFFLEEGSEKDDLEYLSDFEEPHPCDNGCVCDH